MDTKLNQLIHNFKFQEALIGTIFALLGHYIPSMSFLWNSLSALAGVIFTATVVEGASLNIGASRLGGGGAGGYSTSDSLPQ